VPKKHPTIELNTLASNYVIFYFLFFRSNARGFVFLFQLSNPKITESTPASKPTTNGWLRGFWFVLIVTCFDLQIGAPKWWRIGFQIEKVSLHLYMIGRMWIGNELDVCGLWSFVGVVHYCTENGIARDHDSIAGFP